MGPRLPESLPSAGCANYCATGEEHTKTWARPWPTRGNEDASAPLESPLRTPPTHGRADARAPARPGRGSDPGPRLLPNSASACVAGPIPKCGRNSSPGGGATASTLARRRRSGPSHAKHCGCISAGTLPTPALGVAVANPARGRGPSQKRWPRARPRRFSASNCALRSASCLAKRSFSSWGRGGQGRRKVRAEVKEDTSSHHRHLPNEAGQDVPPGDWAMSPRNSAAFEMFGSVEISGNPETSEFRLWTQVGGMGAFLQADFEHLGAHKSASSRKIGCSSKSEL